MKLKSLLALTAMAAVAAASATVTTDNTLCRIKIDSGTTNTIVSIPLVKVGVSADSAIDVSALVLTNNMSAGDSILHKKEDSWDAWTMVDGSGWTEAETVTGYNVSLPESDALARGEAIWVNQKTPTAFYVYGQVASSASTSVEIDGAEDATYTLIGNQNPDAYPFSSAKNWSGLQDEDRIIVPDASSAMGMKEYVFSDGAWVYVKTVSVTYNDQTISKKVVTSTEGMSIPAGIGIWFKTAAGTSGTTRTITW